MALIWWVVTERTNSDGNPIAYPCRTLRFANRLRDEIQRNGGDAAVELQEENWTDASELAIGHNSQLVSLRTKENLLERTSRQG